MINIIYEDVSAYENKELFYELYSKMPDYRKSRTDSLKLDKDKRLSLGAGVLLCRALSAAGFDGSELNISYGEHGKPYFPEISDKFQFSLSHSGNMAMCAFSYSDDGKAVPVGCDIELVRKTDIKIAKRFFAPEEYERIISLSDENERADLFFRYWTLKESFIKLTGKGLSTPLDEFVIFRDEKDEIRVRQNGKIENLIFGEEVPHEGYRASWCAKAKREL